MGMIPHPSRALRSAAPALLPVLISLAFVLPGALAQDEQPADESAAEAATCPIGVYVTSLRDLDPLGDTFGIDFWVWSVHPSGDNPLRSMEFVNAKQIETAWSERRSGATENGPG